MMFKSHNIADNGQAALEHHLLVCMTMQPL